MDKNNLKTRLSALLKEKGLSETEAAKLAKTSQSTLHRVITGEIASPRTQTIVKLAGALGVTFGYLVNGEGSSEEIITTNYDHLMNDLHTVPLLEWHYLVSGLECVNPPRIPCPTQHGPNTFATRVNDNTMTAQYGRSYPEGSIIFIDPDMADQAKNGDRVYAMIEGTIPSFKQFGSADGQHYLQCINLQYPIITKAFEIKGLVIGMWMPES